MKEYKEYRSMNDILMENEELRKKAFQIEVLLIESEGEITPEIQSLMNELEELGAINQEDFEDKVEAYYYVIEDYDGKREVEKKQRERFEKREKAFENSIKRLKKVINDAMVKYAPADPKSKAKIPSLKITAGSVRALAQAYPILDPTTIPPTEKLVEELGTDYVDSKLTWSLTPDEANRVVTALSMYNEKVGSKTNTEAPIPEFVPTLNTNRVKDALKNGIEVGEVKLLNNYQTKFS